MDGGGPSAEFKIDSPPPNISEIQGDVLLNLVTSTRPPNVSEIQGAGSM